MNGFSYGAPSHARIKGERGEEEEEEGDDDDDDDNDHRQQKQWGDEAACVDAQHWKPTQASKDY